MSEGAVARGLHCIEAHPHHWVGRCDELVVLIAYGGSQDDPRHVEVTMRALEQTVAERRGPARVLFVLVAHDKRPSARVLQAIREARERVAAVTERIGVVLVGTGFGAALHRGAINAVLGFVGRSWHAATFGDIAAALRFLGGERPGRYEPLVAECEALAAPASVTREPRAR